MGAQQEHRLTELDSGVRVVTEAMPSVRSIALGIWIGTGSRNETPELAGVSHFLEHLLFKGTARYSAIEISERFDGLGASVNAATGKETTHLHARVLDEHTEEVSSVRSVALGFWVGTGSRNETPDQAGVSHFLEHLLFKGTDRYASVQIDRLFDGWGAELNAGTDKESTTVYARMLDDHLPRAFDVMADMVWRPAFVDVDPERQVVLEEIAMYEDDPQDTVFDVLGEAVFGDHPLGRPIIGRAPVIRDTPVGEIAAFHAAR